MALVGYEQAKAKIETEITAIRKALGAASRSYNKDAAAGEEAPTRKPRVLSAKARKAISLAQKKRWSEVRVSKATDTERKTAKKRPKMSTADRAKYRGDKLGRKGERRHSF
jgi:hypothetical protein